MRIEGGRQYVYVPISGPPGWDPGDGTVTGEIALVPEGSSPGEADWHAASWQGAELRLLAGVAGAGSGAVEYPEGDYIAKARLTAGVEVVPLTSGRVRIGNPA